MISGRLGEEAEVIKTILMRMIDADEILDMEREKRTWGVRDIRNQSIMGVGESSVTEAVLTLCDVRAIIQALS